MRRRAVGAFLETVAFGGPERVEPRRVGGDPHRDVLAQPRWLRLVPGSTADRCALKAADFPCLAVSAGGHAITARPDSSRRSRP